MKIDTTLDNDTSIDPYDLLGDIRIISEGGEIQQQATYIDEWLSGLIRGYKAVEKNEPLQYDLPSEPALLLFAPKKEGIEICYKQFCILVPGLIEFRSGLLEAIDSLLSAIGGFSDGQPEEGLEEIIDFYQDFLGGNWARS